MGKTPSAKTPTLQPFVKWVGGKRALASSILDVAGIHEIGSIKGYFEPFVGGGAMFYELHQRGLSLKSTSKHGIHLSDVNLPLIATYRVIRSDLSTLLKELKAHRVKHYADLELANKKDKGRADRGGATVERGSRSSLYKHYLKTRSDYNNLKQEFEMGEDDVPSDNEVRLTAMFLYLNRAGFNGMYRENSRGEMNIPPGRYAKPELINQEVLTACSRALKGVGLKVESFESAIEKANKGDLVYLDPPYFDTFTAYAKGGFDYDAQVRLADCAQAAANRGAKVIISNSDTKEMRKLYKSRGFTIGEIQAARNINSDGSGRAKVTEIVAFNEI